MCSHLVWSHVKDMFEHDEVDAYLRSDACMTTVHIIHVIYDDTLGITS